MNDPCDCKIQKHNKNLKVQSKYKSYKLLHQSVVNTSYTIVLRAQ